MANGGIGFATGLLSGLQKNVERGNEDERLKAILAGDILGASDPDSGMDLNALGLSPDNQGGITGILSSLGVTKQPGQVWRT